MSDNANTTRTSHRKTFSFLPSSWFAPKLPLQPAGQRSTDSVPHVLRVDKSPNSTLPQADPFHTKEASSPSNIPSPSTSSSILSPKPKFQRHGMKITRKVRKLVREGSENEKPKQRKRVGDVLQDPYSLMTIAPSLLSAPPATSLPSPSPSQTSFAESEHNAGSLRRSATIGNQPKSSSASASMQRARSIGAFPSGPSLAPHLKVEFGERSLSPVVFAPREETSQPMSETSSAFYSESLNPSKAPSLIQEEEGVESPVSEVPTTAVSQRFRNVSSDSKSHARVASSASSQGKAAKLLGAAQDLHAEDAMPSAHLQQPSASSSSSSQLQPPVIRRRSPSPHGVSLREGDLLTTPPQRTMSLRRAQAGRSASQRRLSLDLRNLSPEPFKAGGPARLKKSRSALASMRREPKPDAADELVTSYLNEGSGQGEPADEKQHAQNVRRAKKMMQLFGDKPPKELFQIHSHKHRDDTLDTISILTTVSENRRESRATFTSVTSSLSITRRIGDSVQSSNSEPPSPLVFSAPEGSVESRHDAQEKAMESIEPEPKAESEPEVTSQGAKSAAEPASPTTEESPISPARRSAHSRPSTPASSRPLGPRARPSLASLTVSRSSSHSRQHSQHAQTPLTSEPVPPLPTSPRSPTSAAPFSDLLPTLPAQPPPPVDADELERERQAAASPPPEDFRARRIRAAKLSRFFGVAPHDLTEALANPPASPTFASAPQWATTARRPRTPRQDMLTSFDSTKEPSSTPSLPLQPEERSKSREQPNVTVEVATEIPRPFRLGREKKPVQELDMEAVLDQLRRMR